MGDCLLLHLRYKLHAELADGTASAAFSSLCRRATCDGK